MRRLLDNDVFFAALYRKHVSHEICRSWLDSAKAEGWGIAAETYLSAVRLLMNPAVMGSGVLTATEALNAVDTELNGQHRGRLILSSKKPDQVLLRKATGHRQIMDYWLVQIARDQGAKLATHDAGTLAHWPEYTERVDR
jgi:predicted nucleic acid-binding protein